MNMYAGTKRGVDEVYEWENSELQQCRKRRSNEFESECVGNIQALPSSKLFCDRVVAPSLPGASVALVVDKNRTIHDLKQSGNIEPQQSAGKRQRTNNLETNRVETPPKKRTKKAVVPSKNKSNHPVERSPLAVASATTAPSFSLTLSSKAARIPEIQGPHKGPLQPRLRRSRRNISRGVAESSTSSSTSYSNKCATGGVVERPEDVIENEPKHSKREWRKKQNPTKSKTRATTLETPVFCEECRKTFSREADRTRHVDDIHRGIRSRCTDCGYESRSDSIKTQK
ncbi:hypothetical protein BDQ17DRAFT_856784 [Cyathus striatus]|nr:hypothetical protein BDQ17DRAFT_856784 [Cyathus striatus]